jgi:hypothetical protein
MVQNVQWISLYAFGDTDKLMIFLLATEEVLNNSEKCVWCFESTCNPIFFQVIDGCAFRVYGHWVKKGEGQNRAALFENTPKIELKHIYVSNLSR